MKSIAVPAGEDPGEKSPPLSRLARWAIFGTLFLKLALIGAVYPRNHGAVLLFDSGAYLRSAQAILSLHRFSISTARPAEPEIVRTPGYPALIATVYAIGGERPWLLAAVSSLFVAGTGLIVFRLATAMGGSTAGSVAVLLYCLEPSTFHYGTLVMTEAPFSFCLALALWLLHRLLARRKALVALWAGVVLGVATLVRPVLSFGIVPVLIAVGALLARRGSGFRKAVTLALICGIGALLVLGPWKLRNRKLTGDSSVSQIKNVSLYFFDAAAVVASLERVSVRTVEERFGLHEFASRFGFVATEAEAVGGGPSVESFPGSSRAPLIELAHWYRDRAHSILFQHPARELLVRARGLWLLVSVPNTISWADQYRLIDTSGEFTRLWVYPRPLRAMAYLARTDRLLVLVSIVFFLPVAAIYFLAFKGLRTPGVPAADLRILLLVVLGYLLIVSTEPGYADDRLRVPLFPILCVFAGIGLADVLRARLRGSPG